MSNFLGKSYLKSNEFFGALYLLFDSKVYTCKMLVKLTQERGRENEGETGKGERRGVGVGNKRDIVRTAAASYQLS